MFRSAYVETEDGGFLRCDRPAMARRQLEMSIGLVVMILMATLAIVVATPRSEASSEVALSAPFGEPASRPAIARAAVRIVPISKVETAERKTLLHGS